MQTGDRIRTCREMLGLSQKDLAEKSEINVTQLAHYERNDREPTIENVRRIKRALKVPYEMILGE